MSLKNQWYIAAESRELRGNPISVVIHGRAWALFRDAAGVARAVEDRCAHRNLALSSGRVRGGCLECPYHGWRYDGDGRCVAIPSMGSGADLPRSTAIPSAPVVEQEGFIWVFTGEGIPAEAPFRFPRQGDSGWRTFTMKTRFRAGVEACLENFLDCPHTAFVHRGWFRNHDPRPLRARVRRHRSGVDVEFLEEVMSAGVASRFLGTTGEAVRHTDRFILPNLSRVDYEFGPNRGYVITSQCTPIDDLTTEVYTVITYRFGAWLMPFLRLALEPLSRVIIRQDVDVLREQTRQLEKFGGEAFTHVGTDLVGLHIRAMRRRLDRAEPQQGDAESEMLIRF